MGRISLAIAVGCLLSSSLIGMGVGCDVQVYYSSAGLDIWTFIVEALDAAQEQILIATYHFTDKDFRDTLLRAHQRGVKVAVRAGFRTSSAAYARVQARRLQELRDGGISVRYIDPGNRFAVIDDDLVIQPSDSRKYVRWGSCRSVAFVSCPRMAKVSTERFEELSAVSMNCAICLEKLNSATESDFRSVAGIDSLARSLVNSQPFMPRHCTRSGIEAAIGIYMIGPKRKGYILSHFCPFLRW